MSYLTKLFKNNIIGSNSMRKIFLLIVPLFVIGIFLTLSFFPNISVLSLSNHVVISEIQIAGDGADAANDEFVELYNPTSSDIVMTNWRLTRQNSGGTEANLVEDLDGTIPANGYFLIGHGTGYNGATALNVNYSAASNALTNSYTVLLYSDAGVTLVDKVGFGMATDPEGTAFATNPAANGSIERKASSTSTSETMGGSEATAGNGEDSDNNSVDFVTRTVSDPQNASSTAEIPAITPTPTVTPTPSVTPPITPTPTPTVTLTPTPSDTPTPTETPTPTNTPTGTLTQTPTETPTLTPSLTPTLTLTPTITPSLTPTGSPTPTQTPTNTPTLTPTGTPTITLTPTNTPIFTGPFFTCRLDFITIVRFGISIPFPRLVCVRSGGI